MYGTGTCRYRYYKIHLAALMQAIFWFISVIVTHGQIGPFLSLRAK